MYALRVSELTKKYPEFTLNNISLSVEKGRVVGLVGRNGAGKSTFIKSVLDIIPSEGKVEFFGKERSLCERGAKDRTGYVHGGFDFYTRKTLRSVAQCVSSFYPTWDKGTYETLTRRFNLSENKKVCELSEGMKVKFALVLALSHGAELLIMDEPTSGLDPVSRDEFCDVILSLVREKGIGVLFSTHIISDLTKIADDVAFIDDGELIFFEDAETLLSRYQSAFFPSKEDALACGVPLIGLKPVKNGYEALVESGAEKNFPVSPADLEKIILHLQYERRKNDD